MQFILVEKGFIYRKYEQRYSTLKISFGRKSDFLKRKKNAVKVTAPKITKKVLSNGRLRTELRYFDKR